jgi:hypothetical protein
MTTPTDWRALCAELLDVIGSLVGGVNCGHYHQRDMWKCREIFNRARAELAQPEPTANGEVSELVAELRHFVNEYQKMRGLDPENIYSIHQGDPEKESHLRVSRLTRAADLLERLAQPEPQGPLEHDWLPELRGHFERILCVARSSGGRTVGNIELADRLLDAVVPVSHRWCRPAIKPVPVAERLPGPEDCDAEGRCWLCGIVEGDWRLMDHSNTGMPQLKYCFSHWLPHHALPVPTNQQ